MTTENNGLSITTTSGQLLVSEGSSFQLTTGLAGGVTHFFIGSTDVTSGLTSGGGELGGYLTARDQDIPTALSALDQLAYSISTSVNAENNAGTDLNGVEGTGTNPSGVTGTGTTPLYIFNQPAVSPPATMTGCAANMKVVMTDPSNISAAAFGNQTGDSSNADAMYNLASQSIVNGQTPTNYYSTFVSELGSTVAEVETENTAQTASVTQLQTQQDSLSGVSLNGEASAMQQFETCYQAASQVFNILNTIMTSALNLGVETAVS